MRWLVATMALGCTPTPDDALLDPETCVSCHPTHVQQWRGSMHAYAADDPVFRAMNEQALATPGVPEDFCVQCHAPVALRLGETTDGTNLDEVPQHLRGVTCAFCHQLDGVDGTHNGDVSWTFDGIFKGGIDDPVKNEVHKAAYDPIVDRNARQSSDACGACHDIVLPDGLHLEKTYAEWQGSAFESGVSNQGCVHCHLPGTQGPVATVDNAPRRILHDHRMPGVDVALIEWPERDDQRAAIQDLLDRSLLAELCVAPIAGGSEVRLSLENVLAGHDFPSGASHDRRMWVELSAMAGETVLLEVGQVPQGTALQDVPQVGLIQIHDVALTESGTVSHDIVDAVSLQERALTAPPPSLAPHASTYRWELTGAVPDRVTTRVNLRPIGLDVLDRHVSTGALDPGFPDAMPTFTLGSTQLEWTGPIGSCVGGLSQR